ncbi:MAG: hypothetical protein K9J83_08300 [Desulfarculaceae bacterium]|nr:hypothetical protein [Desulfarculaceae bacterium]
MPAQALIPAPDILPVHWGWLRLLLVSTFVLHILVMNAMLGSGIIAFVNTWRKGGGTGDTVNRSISGKLPFTIAFTVNFGVAPLLFLQALYGQFIYTSSVLMGVYWLSIAGLVIIAYYSAYIYNFRFEKQHASSPLYIGIAVVLMLMVAFLFTNNMTLMLNVDSWTRYFDTPDGTLLNLSDPILFPRYLHFVTASAAVGGLFIALAARFGAKGPENEARMDLGMKWFTYATAFQFLAGTAFFLSLPQEIRQMFMGQQPLATTLLISAVLLAAAAVVLGFKKKVLASSAVVLLLVCGMAVIRDLVRQAYLEPFFNPADLPVQPEYSPMVFFLVTLAAGLLVLGYMLYIAVTRNREVQ